MELLEKKILNLDTFLGFKIKEKDFKKTDLFNAKELFFSNIICGLKWVSNLREKKYDNKYSKLLIEKLNTLINSDENFYLN